MAKPLFLNRDLSWLSFNQRVLMEAGDPSVPLYNRINFLSIFSSNLDEFFRVRMPQIFAFSQLPAKKTSIRDEYPKDLVKRVQSMVYEQLEQYGSILTQQILPELKRNNIFLYYGDPIRMEHREAVRDYFFSKVLSFIQPVIMKEESKQNIFLENNACYLVVDMEAGNDPPGTHSYGLLNIPSSHLPRFLQLPKLEPDHYLIFIDDIIRLNLQEIFPGFIIHGAYAIKLTRDAELDLEDEFTGDIAEKIEKKLLKRDLGPSTRFLFEKGTPEKTREFLREYFSIREEEMIEGGRYHNLKDLGSLPNPGSARLKYDDWVPAAHTGMHFHRSIFQAIRESERLLHLPYHSYNYILRFFNEAAIDPAVTEIFVTLYRVAADSHIANALISAARNGKKVTVFVELKARFDEANNLRWSKKMKEAGVKIINSIPGLKVHAKTGLVIRKEDGNQRSYSVMATGNFNETTGRFYTDHVLFSSKEEFGKELQSLFAYLQSRQQPEEYGKLKFQHLLVSQFNMIDRFNELIEREIRNAAEGKPARIIIKLNNMQEREMITKLYEASNAGVKVDLLVRSICCVAPGVEGQSENIVVRRIVDRYLEHPRIFVFENGGDPEYYMGSADWMNRNLHSRIEVCFPLYEKSLCDEIRNILEIQLRDNVKAVILSTELKNQRIPVGIGEPEVASQKEIYEYVSSMGKPPEIKKEENPFLVNLS